MFTEIDTSNRRTRDHVKNEKKKKRNVYNIVTISYERKRGREREKKLDSFIIG